MRSWEILLGCGRSDAGPRLRRSRRRRSPAVNRLCRRNGSVGRFMCLCIGPPISGCHSGIVLSGSACTSSGRYFMAQETCGWQSCSRYWRTCEISVPGEVATAAARRRLNEGRQDAYSGRIVIFSSNEPIGTGTNSNAMRLRQPAISTCVLIQQNFLNVVGGNRCQYQTIMRAVHRLRAI